MATGDDAAAAGMALVSSTGKVKDGWTEHNKTRDYIAQRTATVTSVAKGGTGATTAAAARSNLGAAAATDISTASATSSPGKLIKWAESGTISVATPTAPTHPATKAYVDAGDEIGGLAYAATEELDSRVDIISDRSNAALDGNLRSVVYNREITSTRRSTWTSSAGDLGYAPSRRDAKTDIRDAGLTLEQLRAIPVVLYRYKAQVALERAGHITQAATEIGTIADDLDALGLHQFVIYDTDDPSRPVSVHYELLALAALSLGQQLANTLDDIDARLATLEARAA